MYLRTLYLHNFRLYEEATFAFCPGVNVLCGANAQGKTTVLEAIDLLITGRSFRTSQLTDLIRLGASSFYVEASFVKHGIEQTLKIWCSSSERKVLYNQTAYPSTSHLLGVLQGVLIAPDDLSLLKGGPQVRRHFLDMQIAQVDPLYVHHHTRYHRAMRQRNCLLRSKDLTSIDSWEYEMAHAAAYLNQQRSQTLSKLEEGCRGLYKTFSNEEDTLGLTHKTNAPQGVETTVLRHHYLQQLQKMRRREMEFGHTLVGPHRDDFTIAIGTKEVRFFASEGQQRSCAAALRFAEWERLNCLASEPPLMLIDDIGVSLDSSRRQKVLNQLSQLGQAFLTTTEALPLDTLTRETQVIPIKKN